MAWVSPKLGPAQANNNNKLGRWVSPARDGNKDKGNPKKIKTADEKEKYFFSFSNKIIKYDQNNGCPYANLQEIQQYESEINSSFEKSYGKFHGTISSKYCIMEQFRGDKMGESPKNVLTVRGSLSGQNDFNRLVQLIRGNRLTGTNILVIQPVLKPEALQKIIKIHLADTQHQIPIDEVRKALNIAESKLLDLHSFKTLVFAILCEVANTTPLEAIFSDRCISIVNATQMEWKLNGKCPVSVITQTIAGCIAGDQPDKLLFIMSLKTYVETLSAKNPKLDQPEIIPTRKGKGKENDWGSQNWNSAPNWSTESWENKRFGKGSNDWETNKGSGKGKGGKDQNHTPQQLRAFLVTLDAESQAKVTCPDGDYCFHHKQGKCKFAHGRGSYTVPKIKKLDEGLKATIKAWENRSGEKKSVTWASDVVDKDE